MSSAGSLRMSVLSVSYIRIFIAVLHRLLQLKNQHHGLINSLIFFQEKHVFVFCLGRKTLSSFFVSTFFSLLLYTVAETCPILTSKNAQHILQWDLI